MLKSIKKCVQNNESNYLVWKETMSSKDCVMFIGHNSQPFDFAKGIDTRSKKSERLAHDIQLIKFEQEKW